MQWVFDASVAMTWCFDDEKTPQTDALLERLKFEPAVVPQLWPLEVANVLVLAARKGRITQDKCARLLDVLGALPVFVDSQTVARAFTNIVEVAVAHRLTAYDASYLDLARRLNLPLATLDAELRAAS